MGISTKDDNFDLFVDKPKKTWENTDIWHTLNCTCETCCLHCFFSVKIHFEDRASLQSISLIDSAHAHTCTQLTTDRVVYFFMVSNLSTVKTLYVSIPFFGLALFSITVWHFPHFDLDQSLNSHWSETTRLLTLDCIWLTWVWRNFLWTCWDFVRFNDGKSFPPSFVLPLAPLQWSLSDYVPSECYFIYLLCFFCQHFHIDERKSSWSEQNRLNYPDILKVFYSFNEKDFARQPFGTKKLGTGF